MREQLPTAIPADPAIADGSGSTLADRILNRLSRVTSSGRFVPEVDGLRFFAILGVVLYHVACTLVESRFYERSGFADGFVYYILSTGGNGVALFFSISAFILTLPFAEAYLLGAKKPNLLKYYTRRVTRLEPPYIICLTIGLFGITLLGETVGAHLWHYLASMIYSHAFIFHERSTISGILWSLEVEVQFYILAPLLAQIFRVRHTALRRTIIVSFIFLMLYLVNNPLLPYIEFLHLTIIGNIAYFAVGFLCADLYLERWRFHRTTSGGWDILFFAVCGADLVLTWYTKWPVDLYAFPVLVFLAYRAGFCGPIFGRIVRNRWLVVIGGMCYTIYLYHTMVLRVIWEIAIRVTVPAGFFYLEYPVLLAVVLPSLFVVSALLFVTCEKPFMQKDWPKKTREFLRSRTSRLLNQERASM